MMTRRLALLQRLPCSHPAWYQSTILGAKIGIGADARLGCLREGSSKPYVSLVGFSALAFPRTPIIALAHSDHEARWWSEGNFDMSTPISDMITSTVFKFTPVMPSRSSISFAKGSVRVSHLLAEVVYRLVEKVDVGVRPSTVR